MNSPLHLLSNLHRRVLDFLTLIFTQVKLLRSHTLGLLFQRRDRRQVIVRRQMPKERRGDAHQRPVGEAGPAVLDNFQRAFVDNNLVVSSLDQPACGMLQLLARLHQQVVAARGDLDGDALTGVPRPDVQARVA